MVGQDGGGPTITESSTSRKCAAKPVITLAARIVREDGTLVADGEVVVLLECRAATVTAGTPLRFGGFCCVVSP